jgi:uncharacterized membrane protein
MPQAERDDAVRYYDEFISDADNEADAISGLGSPASVAADIIAEWGALTIAQSSEASGADTKTAGAKRKSNAFKVFWIVLLSVFAAPAALPVALAIGAAALAIGFALLAVVLSIAATAAALIISVPVMLVLGITAIPMSPLSACMAIGIALASFGIGVMLIKTVKIIAKHGFGGLVHWISGIIKRRSGK